MKTDPLIEKLRKLADGLQDKIDDKFRDRETNTQRKQAHAQHARNEGQQLRRIQIALRALADARERGNLPAILQSLKSKADVGPLVGMNMEHVSNGWHGYHVETGKYRDQSPAAVALRALIDNTKSASDREADADREQQLKIERMEQALRFADIAGFFPTPPAVIERMLDWGWEIPDNYKVLEPSAGKGDICDAVRERSRAKITAVEINHSLCDILAAKGYNVERGDFMSFETKDRFDVVLMNPPFERGQDADHVRHAFNFLKPGGRLVSVMSSGTFHRNDKKSVAFRQWLESIGGVVEDLPADAFKSGFVSTGVSTKLILAVKPEAGPAYTPDIVVERLLQPTPITTYRQQSLAF